MDDMERALARLRKAEQRVRTADTGLTLAVLEARRAGASWKVVGDAIGVTGQGANSRWSHLQTEDMEHLVDEDRLLTLEQAATLMNMDRHLLEDLGSAGPPRRTDEDGTVWFRLSDVVAWSTRPVRGRSVR